MQDIYYATPVVVVTHRLRIIEIVFSLLVFKINIMLYYLSSMTAVSHPSVPLLFILCLPPSLPSFLPFQLPPLNLLVTTSTFLHGSLSIFMT